MSNAPFFLMDRQKEILKVFQNQPKGKVLTKSEIIELGRICYYYNTRKHVGDVLSRMVKNNLLRRLKKGSYQWTGTTVPSHGGPVINDPNQVKLF